MCKTTIKSSQTALTAVDRFIRTVATIVVTITIVVVCSNAAVCVVTLEQVRSITCYTVSHNDNSCSHVSQHLTWCHIIGPIPWGHSGLLCHALSLSSSSLWTSHAACAIAIAGVRLATLGDWQCNGGRSSEWAQHFSNASCLLI